MVENNYDKNGLAALDEFSDAVLACIDSKGSINMAIDSVVEFEPDA